MPDFSAAITSVAATAARPGHFLASYTLFGGQTVTEACATRDEAWEWLRCYDEQMQIMARAATYLRVRKNDRFYASQILNNDSPPPDLSPA